MNRAQSGDFFNQATVRETFFRLYGADEKMLKKQTERYSSLVETHSKKFGVSECRIFSSPGRSEIGGNHTDHNLGKVLAASIQLDCIGAVSACDDGIISIYDLTYNEDYSLDTTHSQRKSGEKGSSALIRGIVQGFKNAGYKTGGFKATFTSDVIAAAGVSSSASFEMIICCILSNLYNNGTIPVQQFARIGQFAENKYWDKGSGLLDQMACAVGGLIGIDFKNPAEPAITKVPFDFSAQKYDAIIVNTGKSHADLSAEYSAIPNEMKTVAQFFKQETLRGLRFADITDNLSAIRHECGDRAVLRAFHFLAENDRVDAQITALQSNDFKKFLALINDSGNSSWKWLQNTLIPTESREQSIPVCLALTELFIAAHCTKEKIGACRIHGGGFAGVILAFLPTELTEKYKTYIHQALATTDTAKSPVYILSIRPLGTIEIT